MKLLSSLSKKDLQGKICLLRVDLNIKNSELDKNNLRIQAILPTIKFLLKNKVKIVLLSHRGRPIHQEEKLLRGVNIDWQFAKENFDFTLSPFVKLLENILKTNVGFLEYSYFMRPHIRRIIQDDQRSVLLFENLRFFLGEESDDWRNVAMARRLASLGDFYVNDAFAVSHRADSSVCAITKFLPSYAGLLLEKEVKNLDKVLKNHRHPLVVIMGGAKISDKIGLIKNFLSTGRRSADYFLIGGGIAHNFLKVQGLPIGDSIYDKTADEKGVARRLMRSKKIILPIDYVVEKRKILDLGPNTARLYSDIIKKARVIIWNGPMGYFENKKFARASEAVAKAIIGNQKAFSVIGGGETSSFFQNDARNFAENHAELRRNKFSDIQRQVRVIPRLWISTGGGAMLEYLSGKKLPGIKALE